MLRPEHRTDRGLADRARGSQPRRARSLAATSRGVAGLAVASLVLSCSSEGVLETGRESSSTPSPSPSESARPGEPGKAKRSAGTGDVRAAPEKLPAEFPTTAGPSELAGHLGRAMASLRASKAEPAELRAAGEFQQQAIRLLANADRAFRRAVLARLSPEAAYITRSCVVAARALDAMGGPARRLPDWRIVAPRAADELYAHYRRAEARTGVSWTYLAAINLVETRMGRIRGTSTAGARGPMQFIPPTWARYGAGGDITDPRDAILAAARLLRDHGAPRNMNQALYHYNPSELYVRAVATYAETMQRSSWAYRGYWHWRVFYSHTRATYVLPVGYPAARPVRLPGG